MPVVDVEVVETTDRAPLRALRRAWEEEDVGQALDDPTYDDRFDEWFVAEAARRRYWLASLDGAPVGMASVVTLVRPPVPGRELAPWGYVHQVYVDAAHRSRGVGGALMAGLIDACRADGYQQLVLHPRERSVPFYERLGFGPADHLLSVQL